MSFSPFVSRQGADGYLAFFTGPSEIAGDNDLYWDRTTNTLKLRTIAPINESLTLNGPLSIQESNAPAGEDGYGKLYVLNDGYLNYKAGDNQEFRLNVLDASSIPVDGYVLTSDAAGKGTWRDPALTLERLIVNEDGTLILSNDGNATFTALD